jgi:hypothetical protein
MIEQRSWFAALDFEAMSGSEAGDVLEFAVKLERLAVAIKLRSALRLDDHFVWRDEGHRTSASYLAEKTGSSVGNAHGVLETAKQLAELPDTARALHFGTFSPQQVTEIASAATVHPAAEGDLLEMARHMGLKGLKNKCAQLKALNSWENDEVGRYNAIRKSRFLRHWTDVDGAMRIEGRLDPVAGARIVEALKCKASFFFDEARKAGVHESMGAYMADGLEALADDAICGTGTGIARPSVILRVDLAALQRGETQGDNEVCEIPGVGPVPLATATRVLGDAFLKIVISDGRDVQSVCHLGRTIPVHLETALQERDPVCVVPKCENDYRLEIHHRVPVTEHGPTSMENLVRICRWHHDLVTYEGWKLEGQPGSWAWHPPPDFADFDDL